MKKYIAMIFILAVISGCATPTYRYTSEKGKDCLNICQQQYHQAYLACNGTGVYAATCAYRATENKTACYSICPDVILPDARPTPLPPSTHYAALEDVDSVPYLNDQGRELYRRFLTRPMPRAFVITPSGLSYSSNGGFDPFQKAMSTCQQKNKNCQPYAVDDYVVWVRPTPAPPSTHFAQLVDPSAVPYLNDKGRQGYQKFLTFRKPRAFAIAPDGAWSASSRGNDPLLSALDACSKGHEGCRLYAVDNDVVWVKK